jgi:AraC-like DNA-binding protein
MAMLDTTWLTRDMNSDDVDLSHAHDEGQLLYATSGIMRVTAGRENWILAPQRALWIPPRTAHAVTYRGRVALRTLYFRADAECGLPRHPQLIEVAPLLRELILALTRPDAGRGGQVRIGLIHALILEEFKQRARPDGNMTTPQHARLRIMADAILANPADKRTIDDWAKIAGMSRRTLTRSFRDETGMSFTAWRQQVRLQEAIARLDLGQPITTIAYAVGYESPATFSAIFRRHFGTSPSQYRSDD